MGRASQVNEGCVRPAPVGLSGKIACCPAGVNKDVGRHPESPWQILWSWRFSHLFSARDQTWTGAHLRFEVGALGQVASGSLDVAEDQVRLEVFLPWLLAPLARKIRPLIRKEGILLLEKKR
jgi:Putative polyhydroxyalkanoic acid system protein (PHA_gran_rgn)